MKKTRLINITSSLKGSDNKTNIEFPFEIKGEWSKLQIKFSYQPALSSDKEAIKQIEKAHKKYLLPKDYKRVNPADEYLPVENLLTLSLWKGNDYIGAYHNKKNPQEIVIGSQSSSLGFKPCELEGEFLLEVNCHSVASKKLKYKLEVELVK